MMWGLSPGPMLFINEADFAWGLIASLFLANLLTLLIALGIIPILIRILSVPVRFMIPCITTICVVGAYSTSNSMYGVIVMFISGVIGYILDKNQYSTAPMLLAFVLAPLLESNMRKAFTVSQGNPLVFVDFAGHPIAATLMLIFFVILCVPIVKFILRKVKANKAAE